MKVILEKPFFIEKALGVQAVKSNCLYRRLQFVELHNEHGVYLAYNMLTKELAELSKEEYMLLLSERFPSESQSLPLIEKWFAVPAENDDLKLYKQLVSLYNLFDKNFYYDGYTILTTTDCNARCFYCYEKDLSRINMTEETAHNVAEFIASHCKNRTAKLHWFGGEPLCNISAIDTIAEDLLSAKIPFTSSMTSNGYLFSDSVVKRAKEKWNLKSVQITLDGMKDVYNRCKNYIYNDPNPFERVCNNIELLLNNAINVKIRLNMGLHNRNNLNELADYLCQRFNNNRKLRVYVALLFDFSEVRTAENKELLVSSVLEIEQKLFESGIASIGLGKGKFTVNYCMADNKHTTLINPNGDLGRCEHYADDYLWGTVLKPDFMSSALSEWQIMRDVPPNCKTCKYYIECLAPKKCPSFEKNCVSADLKLRSERKKRSMYAEYLKSQFKECDGEKL